MHFVTNCKYLFSNFLTYKQFDFAAAVVLIVFVAFLVSRVAKTKRNILAICLIVAGAAMNIIERHFLGNGCVRDYINFFGLFVFNFYDLLFMTGVFVLGLDVLLVREVHNNG